MSDDSPDAPPPGPNPPHTPSNTSPTPSLPPPAQAPYPPPRPGTSARSAPPNPAGQPGHAWVWAHQARPARRHATSTLVLSIVAALLGGMIVGAGAVGLVWAVRDGDPPTGDRPGDGIDALGSDDAPDDGDAENNDAADDDDAAAGADARPAEDVLPGELDRLMTYVEGERGLTFTDDVEIQFLDDDTFADAWFSTPPGYEPPAGPADYGATFAALGLTSSPDDYYAAEQSNSIGGVMGFYDPWTDELVVRGTMWTAMVEGTVVHELTHALQDQHFDLAASLDRAGPETDLAARALFEGDANRIEAAYVGEQPLEWQDEYVAAWEDITVDGPYDPLLEMLGAMPYWLGDQAIYLLLERGDSLVNVAMRNPPTTTAELVEINSFIWDQIPEVEMPGTPPAPDGAEVLDEGVLGVAFLELLHVDVQTDWFGNTYLDGWRGDGYTTWASSDGACTAVVITLAAEALGDAEEYFEPWVERTGGAVERQADGSGITLTSCADW